MADTTTAEPDGIPIPQRYWAILAIALGLTLAVLDGAIANVALPTIAADLNSSPASSIWVVNAYQLAVTVAILPLSSIGDIYGYRRVYIAGLIGFGIASLGCALADSLVTLAIARAVQGVGAACIMSVNGALVRVIYPRAWLGRGLGINATVGSISSAAGPTVAAAILSVAHWQWLFAVNVPIAALGLVIALRALPRARRSPHQFDVVSAALCALAFGLLITGIDGVAHDEAWPIVVLEVLASVLMGALLVVRQASRASPLLPVDLMRIPLFALSVATSICAFAAQGLAMVSLPFLFQNTLGRSQVDTGLLMTPWPMTVAVIAPFIGRLADKVSAGLLGGVGLALMASGLGLLGFLPDHPSAADIVWRITLCGLGFGLFNTPNNRALIMAAPRSRTGGASGMQATARLLGQTIGASLAALVFGRFAAHGTTITLVVAGCIAAAAACVSLTRMADSGRSG
jgi:DHA2 family multidrug resistance protein-like MFS transporter